MCQSSLEEKVEGCSSSCPTSDETRWSGSLRTHHGGPALTKVMQSPRRREEYLEEYVVVEQHQKNHTRNRHVDGCPDEQMTQDGDVCWICHDDDRHCSLEKICSCPWLRVHRRCLARWQLQQAGKVEEKECRFCGNVLPDWREAHEHLPRGRPVMTVVHDNVVHQVVVEPGESGQRKFQQDIRRIFGLKQDDAIQLTFGCRIPDSPHEVTLDGWNSYDAAVHCASLSAGQREKRQHSHDSPPKRTVCQRRKTSSSSPQGVLRRLFSATGQSVSTVAHHE